LELNANCMLCFGVFHSLCLFDVRRTLFVVRAHIRSSTLGTSLIILPLFPRIFCRSQFSSAPFSQPFIHNTTHPPACSHSILQLLHNIRTHPAFMHSRLKKLYTCHTHGRRVESHSTLLTHRRFLLATRHTTSHNARARDHIPNKAPGPSTTAFPFQKNHDHMPQKIVHIHLVCAVEAVQTTQSVTAARWPFLTHTLALMLAAARRRRHRRRWQRVPQQRAAEMAVHRVM
jgi:hypothetical protein